MADYPALPLWTDAFLGDTLHLSAEEVGCYMLLLMVAWRSSDNSLPDNDEDLARFCRVPLRRWKTRIRPRLEPFFTIKKTQTWRQKRLDAERNFVTEKSLQGKRAAEARWLKEKKTENADASPEQMPDGMQKPCEPDTPTPTPIKRREEGEKMASIWNEVCQPAGMPKVLKLHPTRVKKLTKRLEEDFGRDLDQWRTYCRRIAASPFLTGQNDRGWQADLDWVLEPRNLAKIVEGKYDDRDAPPPNGANGAESPFQGEYEDDLRRWYQRVKMWRDEGFWLENDWGPPPDKPGCEVPGAVMEEFPQ